MKKIIDVSMPVSSNTTIWPGAPKVDFTSRSAIEYGAICNDTNLKMNLHTGTHVDAPMHFYESGSSVDEIPINKMIGLCQVVEINENQNDINEKLLQEIALDINVKKVIFKTRNSSYWRHSGNDFNPEYTAFTSDAAKWIVDNEFELVGIDYLSVQKYSDGPEVHYILLGNNVIVIEGLDLRFVKPDIYRLICLPIKLIGVEAAPARVILEEI